MRDDELTHLTDCHFVPQTEYVKGVEHIFCTAADMKEHIKSRFPEVTENQLALFREQKTYANYARKLRPKVLQKINDAYAGDFKL